MQKRSKSPYRQAGSCLICFLVMISIMPQAHSCEELPDPKEFPLVDGKIATSDEMRRNNKTVNEYVTAGKAYIECLQELEDSKEIDKYRAWKLRNKAIDDMEKLAALFNRQLRIFKRRN